MSVQEVSGKHAHMNVMILYAYVLWLKALNVEIWGNLMANLELISSDRKQGWRAYKDFSVKLDKHLFSAPCINTMCWILQLSTNLFAVQFVFFNFIFFSSRRVTLSARITPQDPTSRKKKSWTSQIIPISQEYVHPRHPGEQVNSHIAEPYSSERSRQLNDLKEIASKLRLIFRIIAKTAIKMYGVLKSSTKQNVIFRSIFFNW
jgi:hypothetical protein